MSRKSQAFDIQVEGHCRQMQESLYKSLYSEINLVYLRDIKKGRIAK